MSRSGYSDDCEGWALIRWRGAVAQATYGKRGQAFLHDLLAALDALPQKRLIANDFANEAGEFCALGAVGAKRGVDMTHIDPDDPSCRDPIAQMLGIAPALAAEIMFENDDWRCEEPEARWSRMRAWVASQIRDAATSAR